MRDRFRGDGDREPQVERVIALVVVADAGMLVHHLGGRLQPVGPDPHGNQAALIAQTARVEDPADLPNDLCRLCSARRAMTSDLGESQGRSESLERT